MAEEPNIITDQQTVTITMPEEVIEPKVDKLNDLIEAENKANPIPDTSTVVPTQGVVTPPVEVVKEVVKEDKPNPVGRPCEFCQNKDEVMKITNKYVNQAMEARKTTKPIMPYIEDLALDLKHDDTTLVSWANKTKEDGSLEHPEFLAAYSLLKTCQKLLLLRRTLGRFNAAGAMFQLSRNHNMIEVSKQYQAGVTGEPLKIEIIEERKIPDAE